VRPILFPSDETAFTSNGLGRLDPISCYVTEERNGQYELEMVVSMDDRHYGDIEEGRILLVRHDDTPDKQPFEIYYISRPLNGQVTVLAHHITYRTATITVMPFEADSIASAMLGLKTNSVGDNPFTFSTSKAVNGYFSVSQPSTLRSLLAGESGSLLDVYGTGEYEWDRFDIRLHLNRGRETSVTLRYGKDITDLKKTTDMSSLWTGVVPFWLGAEEEDSETQILVTLPERVIYASNARLYAYTMNVPLDLSGSFKTPPTVEELRAAAQSFVANNEITGIPTSIDVSFINAAQVEEYREVAGLQRLQLCDTLTIVHSRLGVSAKAKIVKTVFDVIQERYATMTVGDVRPDLATTLSSGLKASLNDMKKMTATKTDLASGMNGLKESLEGEMADAINEQTMKIIGGSGGYIVIQLDSNGKPRQIFAMNTDDVSTATQVLRINNNGIGFSSTGINGTYRSAWTLDGKLVADFIQSGTLTATLIREGTLTDVNGLNSWNLETGDFTLASTTTVGGSTIDSIAEGKASAAVSAFDSALTQQAVFNRLTGNGQTQGIYLKNGKLYINATYMDTGTLDADLISSGGIAGSKIADDAITTAKIAAAAITAAKIAVGAVLAEAIAAGAVSTTKIADGAVTTDKVEAGAITADKIADSAVTADKIAAGAITADMISEGTMSADRISGGALTLGGNNNANGSITVKDAAGTVIGTINNVGIVIQGALKTAVNASSVYAELAAGGLTFWMKKSTGQNDTVGSIDYSNNLFQIRGAGGLTISGDNAWLDLAGSAATFRCDLNATGTKSRVVSTEQYADRLLYCYETASPMFGDIGEGVIGEDGKCFVWLDPVFAQTIATDQYQVFLQRYGEGDIYVSERRGSCFIVAGTPGLSFGWEVKARQKDYDQKRLDRTEEYTSKNTNDYGGSAAQYISRLREGRIAL